MVRNHRYFSILCRIDGNSRSHIRRCQSEELDIKKGSKASRWNTPRWSDSFVIVCLFVVLLTMIAGLIILSNDLVIKAPGGDTRLPAAVLYPLFAIAVIVSIALVYWMVRTRYKLPEPNPVRCKYPGETTQSFWI